MKKLLSLLLFLLPVILLKAQYVQPERNDTTYIYPQTKFDSLAARSALARGTSTIKGVAFTKPKTGFGFKAPLAPRIYANRVMAANAIPSDSDIDIKKIKLSFQVQAVFEIMP